MTVYTIRIEPKWDFGDLGGWEEIKRRIKNFFPELSEEGVELLNID